MKTKILIPVLMFVSLITYAGSNDESGYVVSNNDTIYAARYNLNLTMFRLH